MNERESTLRTLLAKMPVEWRDHWCDPGEFGCACMGCANNSGGLEKLGYTAAEWRYARRVPATFVPDEKESNDSSN